jgi:hypothetical protein
MDLERIKKIIHNNWKIVSIHFYLNNFLIRLINPIELSILNANRMIRKFKNLVIKRVDE